MESKQPPTSGAASVCPNCAAELPTKGKYCAACGQQRIDKRVSLGLLIREFLADSLNLESKLWRTLLALFVPGKLTQAFFRGQRQAYLKPVRLFFVMAILTVAVISFFQAEFAENFFLDLDEDFRTELHYTEFLQKASQTADSLKVQYPAISPALLDSLLQHLQQGSSDSVELGVRFTEHADGGWNLRSNQIARHDLAQLSLDSLLAKYDITHIIEQHIFRQNLRLQMQGENFAPYILNKTVWMMLLLMPLLAVCLKLLYIRRDYYYVEHLIYSFHTHTFVFLLLIILMWLDNVAVLGPYMGKLWLMGFVGAELYFFLSLKRVYGQGRGKRWIKFLLLNLFYIVLFFAALILTIILAALFY